MWIRVYMIMNFCYSLSVAVESLDKKVITVEGNKFIDSGGGFLIEEEDQDPDKLVNKQLILVFKHLDNKEHSIFVHSSKIWGQLVTIEPQHNFSNTWKAFSYHTKKNGD